MHFVFLASLIFLGLASSAEAEKSSKLATAKPVDTLAFYKGALRAAGVQDEADARKIDNFVPLTSCSTSYDYMGEEKDEDILSKNIPDLAYDLVYMEAVLRVAGYPKHLWQADLVKFQQSKLASLENYDPSQGEKDPIKVDLAKKLNDYKKTHGGKYKKIIPGQEGCGAGEIDVRIQTIPSAQRVQYINMIKYDLCVFQKIDPKGADCDHWFDYGGKGALMAGRYKVRATWSDGTTVFRDLDADSLPEDKNGLHPFRIQKQ